MCIYCDLSKKDALLAKLFADTPRPCRASSAPRTAAVPPQAFQAAQSDTQAKTTGETFRPPPPQRSGYVNKALGDNGSITTETKRPAILYTVARLEVPEKPKTKVRDLKLGQALILSTGNSIYRLTADIYLYIALTSITVHFSIDKLVTMEGTLAPYGSKITFTI